MCKKIIKMELRKIGYGDVNCIIRLTIGPVTAWHYIIVGSCVQREKVTILRKDVSLILWAFCNGRMVLISVTLVGSI
jgi:hypothetical protein